jgi:hypothetical protein
MKMSDEPMKKHEANLQFEIALELHKAGVPFELEYKTPVGRQDIAIIENGKLYGFFECKHKVSDHYTYQKHKYKMLQVPFHYVDWETNKDWIVDIAKKWIAENTPTSRERLDLMPEIKTHKNTRKRRKNQIQHLIDNLDEDVNFRK